MYLEAPLTDYAQQTALLNYLSTQPITQMTRTICYDQAIYDDDVLEEDEWLGLTLVIDSASVPTIVQAMYDQAAILIHDNESELLCWNDYTR